MLPSLKINKVNWNHIFDNMLDKNFWKTKWTLMDYDNVVITMQLYSIDIQDDKVWFEVTCNSEYAMLILPMGRLDDNTSSIFTQRLERSVISAIRCYEGALLEETSTYRSLLESDDEREQLISDEAEEFLDENNIHNDSVRDAYIESQISKNKSTLASDWKFSMLDKYIPHIYRTYLLLSGGDAELFPVTEVEDIDIQEYIDNVEEIELEDIT